MSGETTITLIGNLTADPELRYTQSGIAVAGFTVASNTRKLDRTTNEWVQDDALFLRCSVWRDQAEHVAASLEKGHTVIVVGVLRQRSYETKEGEKRTTYELDVQDIGPALRFARAAVHRVTQRDAPATWAPEPTPEDALAAPAASGRRSS